MTMHKKAELDGEGAEGWKKEGGSTKGGAEGRG